jgi:DNA-binding response OmpR family regulator
MALDTASRQLVVRGRIVAWPAKEVPLLERLMRPAGAVMPIDTLLRVLPDDDGLGSKNALPAYLHRLRCRLSGTGTAVTVSHAIGTGYQLTRRSNVGN